MIIGYSLKSGAMFYEMLIDARFIPQLNVTSLEDKGILVGSAVTLSALGDKLKDLAKSGS